MDLLPQVTKDGSLTFFSGEFQESFHSLYGAKQESFLKFVIPTQVPLFAQTGNIKILDVCYGLGYNTAVALESIRGENASCRVEIIGLESDPLVPQAAICHNVFADWHQEYKLILKEIAFKHCYQDDNLSVRLIINDGRKSIQEILSSGFLADVIFLDPFSPPHCPQLWTVEFIEQIALCLQPGGLLATYSCAAAVRTALISAGLIIGSTTPVGRRTPGTIAGYAPHQHKYITETYPLGTAEIEHLKTRAAIPYRDPQLQDEAPDIMKRREQEVLTSTLESTSQWRKRWLTNNTPTQ
ncbi:hypothetical protein FLX35_09170 [Cylindrospermopsis raciborskii LB2897]|jgi:tRNA U34 5-methylaminomethyl-2-thiouridine-forming methyltransferase MnmC|uniref:tRNA (5-methylaminomethyl-2-thiouridine)(34)-methyltransferase MnmD n=1 Tax=Cylindrospermopsis raciborskii TaxID=77022 RepID=UPI001454C9AE|nr:MnmC family methyltransferase [Cylindrospermopsis raciborskii]MBG0744414.1 hypothetical protein [Cylindrospermopsis raciborskii KL1]NLQ07788.1 hypothetical protein [Cylindrospermopsis raciborskii LB2897]